MSRKFIFEDEHTINPHGVYEIAWLSYYEYNNLPNNTSVMVCGEKDGIGAENPHFHIRIDNSFDFEIKFDHMHNLEIWRSTTDKLDWSGYEHVRDAVKNWLEEYYDERKLYKNYETIVNRWRNENPEHEIDDKNKYLELYKKLKNN